MKRSVLFIIAILLLAACTQSVELDVQKGTLALVAKTESPAATKTVVEGATLVYWEPGDAISVFSGDKSGKFVTDLAASAGTATYKGTLGEDAWSEGMDLWAVYPYSEAAVFDGNSITTELPSRQVARAGSFGKDMNLAVARSTTTDLQFYNVCGGVRFTLSQDGITEVELSGLNGETLAGTVKVGFEEGIPVIQDVTERKTSITVTPPDGETFKKDVWYYIVAIPGALENGFTFRYQKPGDSASREFSKAVTIKRGVYGILTHADRGMGHSVSDEAIVFKDDLVKSIVVKHFDIGGDGELSYREAAIVLSFLVDEADTRSSDGLVNVFAGTGITTFDELVYFTGLTKIDEEAFAGCTKLTTITIPENITAIGDNAFNGCTSLEAITVTSRTPFDIGAGAFANTGNCPILVPNGSEDAYIESWGEYENRIRPIPYSQPEMVDLGLPSGTLWASFNLGATRPDEFGDYFAWGETAPKTEFNSSNYKWFANNRFTKYVADISALFPEFSGEFYDGKSILEPEDDAATANLGDKWRMPTAGEWEELIHYCTHKWVWLDGVDGDGVKITGPNGNSIILPSAGGISDNQHQGGMGAYWSSSLSLESNFAWGFLADYDLEVSSYGARIYGMSVRPVYGDMPILPESISLDKTEIDLPLCGATTLNVSFFPDNVTYKSVRWESSNRLVATVSSEGIVYGLKVGETTIIAYTVDGCKWAECKVRVSIPEPVDLGLPSGVRWGASNLGSPDASGYGDYFAWGETSLRYQPGEAQSDSPTWVKDYDQGGEFSRVFDMHSYQFCWDYQEHEGGYSYNIYKYCFDWGLGYGDNQMVLEPDDDAAHVLMGGDWRIPSWAEFLELRDWCTWEWTTQDGVCGQKVTGPNGNSIFLPAAGLRFGEKLDYVDSDGVYWTSSIRQNETYAIGVNLDESGVAGVGGYYRYYGLSIRPVYGRPAVPVESVSMDKTSIVLGIDETESVKASTYPDNASFTGLYWTTNSSRIISLSNGSEPGEKIVRGLADGTSQILALSLDGGKWTLCEVKVVSLSSDLTGSYAFESTGGVSESPWTVQIVKDANDSKKVWFHNLFAKESFANESTRFYGIVDEEQGTIEIPFGQQTAYLYQGDSPIVLYWLDADNQDGKDGACTVTILKDASGRVCGLDFGEFGFWAFAEERKTTIGYAYPHITAVKQ